MHGRPAVRLGARRILHMQARPGALQALTILGPQAKLTRTTTLQLDMRKRIKGNLMKGGEEAESKAAES